jgi:phosphoglycolate phosphatase-like HAD superfamily hydrolase
MEKEIDYNSISILAFDFDGVILQSADIKNDAYYELFQDIREEDRKRVLEYHIHHPGIERRIKIELLLSNVLNREFTDDDINALLTRYQGLVRERLLMCPEVPGIKNFLEEMQEKLPLYVVSAAPEREVKEICTTRSYTGYFKGIYGAPKKKTDILKNIASREKVKASSVLFIGDRSSDQTAANNASISFLALYDGKKSEEFNPSVPHIKDFLLENSSIIKNIIDSTK